MKPHKKFRLKLRSRTLVLGERTLIMGILNITPDSFSDAGKFFDVQKAINHAVAMERDGADLLDIGAESTRPGSQSIAAEEELRRLVKVPISIDTQKSEVAEAALDAGAEMINDISGLKHNTRLAEVVAEHSA